MKYFLFIILCITGAFRKNTDKAVYITTNQHNIAVYKGAIFYDQTKIYQDKYDDFIYNDKANRLIEDHGVTFLAMAINDAPNLDRLHVFQVLPLKAILRANAIKSPVIDYDHDGYLEFGGCGLTELYPNPDSMYYVPSAYFEIRDGKITSDKALTKMMDIKRNGVYLPPAQQKDRDGNCCTVIYNPDPASRNEMRKRLGRKNQK